MKLICDSFVLLEMVCSRNMWQYKGAQGLHVHMKWQYKLPKGVTGILQMDHHNIYMII